MKVEAEGKEPKSLIAVGPAKDAREVHAVLVYKTEYTNSCQERHDVLRHDFPNEHTGESPVEELQLWLHFFPLPMQGFQQ